MTEIQIEPVARALLGAPNKLLSRDTELRYGTYGSLKIDLNKNAWFDHEAKEGGGVLDLIKREVGVETDREAFQWLERENLGTNGASPNGRRKNGNDGDHLVAKPITVESYEYHTKTGDLALVVDRRQFRLPDGSFEMKDGKPDKTFLQRRPDRKNPGQWHYNANGVSPLIYRVSEIVEAAANGHTIYIVEGERKANALWARNIPATCNPGGACKWRPEHSEFVRGADVVILPDNDPAGCAHLEKLIASLTGIANKIQVVELPGLPSKGDIIDWIDAGGTREQFDALVKHDAAEWIASLSRDDQTFDKVNEEWGEPDWSMLDDRRGQLPDFPVDVLSPEICDFLERSAHGAGVMVDHVAVPLLSIASSLVGTSRRIAPSRSWSEPCTLWTGVVGYSGTGKTPGLDVAKRALSKIEHQRRDKIAELKRDHETRQETARAAQKKWKAEVQAAVDTGRPPPPMPQNAVEPGEFTAPRLYVSDATIERPAVLLKARSSGIQLIGDELAGLFLNFGRYSGGQDKEFWLEAWNGKYFVVERMGRPPVVVEHLLVGVTGGFQPDKLVRSFEGDDDGMYARFLFGWPQEPKYQALSNSVAEDEPELANAFARLIDLSGNDGIARRIQLANDAVEEFGRFRQFLHQAKESLDGREREWWAKGATHVLRLAGTLAYLDWAWRGGSEPTEIASNYVTAAVRLWREYFWPHSRAALRQVGLTDRHRDARRALRWIRGNGKTEVSVKDIRRDALGERLDAQQTLGLLNTLVSSGWLLENTPKSGPKGGKPARRWKINPSIRRNPETAETAETEEEQNG